MATAPSPLLNPLMQSFLLGNPSARFPAFPQTGLDPVTQARESLRLAINRLFPAVTGTPLPPPEPINAVPPEFQFLSPGDGGGGTPAPDTSGLSTVGLNAEGISPAAIGQGFFSGTGRGGLVGQGVTAGLDALGFPTLGSLPGRVAGTAVSLLGGPVAGFANMLGGGLRGAFNAATSLTPAQAAFMSQGASFAPVSSETVAQMAKNSMVNDPGALPGFNRGQLAQDFALAPQQFAFPKSWAEFFSSPRVSGGDDPDAPSTTAPEGVTATVSSDPSAAGPVSDAGPANAPSVDTSDPDGPAGSGGGDGGDGGTVICTELHRQGLMDDETWAADVWFGLGLGEDTLRGYHLWAIHVAKAMRRSKLVTALVAPVALRWAQEMAFQMHAKPKGSLVGRAIMAIGVPICKWLGYNSLVRCHRGA